MTTLTPKVDRLGAVGDAIEASPPASTIGHLESLVDLLRSTLEGQAT